MLQQLGCHFCTKGCQNPRAHGSQGAAARDLVGRTALETHDAPTNRTSCNKISEARESAADPPGRKNGRQADGLLPLQDPPQPAEGTLEVLALRPLPQGQRPAELRARLRARPSLLRAVPLLLLANHERHRHDGARWHRRVGPALFFTDDLAARSRRQFLRIPSPRESHRRRRVAARVASTAPRRCSRRDYAWPLWLLAWTVSVLLSVMATATFRRAATSTPGAIPRCTKDEWARRRVELNSSESSSYSSSSPRTTTTCLKMNRRQNHARKGSW